MVVRYFVQQHGLRGITKDQFIGTLRHWGCEWVNPNHVCKADTAAFAFVDCGTPQRADQLIAACKDEGWQVHVAIPPARKPKPGCVTVQKMNAKPTEIEMSTQPQDTSWPPRGVVTLPK